ncbi:LLM class flavin-dependent oxidoreductase [Nocardioides dubius]|uniref:Luciferase-like domain-containing protein n=1 Tax=Nocardioides dubius TaxID=317019 RepID=A0ABP4E9W3_9ACTN
MVKVILQLYPVIPATREERITKAPIGRDADLYQQAIRDMPGLIKAADELGLWGVSGIEHHFHSEGYEIGPNPGLMNVYWSSFTKNMRVGQLGYTITTHNPFRVAEDIAVIDHITQGRTFAGFSRGFQQRWTDVIGQNYGSKATKSPTGHTAEQLAAMTDEERKAQFADDAINRSLFEENVNLVVDCWTQDSVERKEGRWQVPVPYEEGIEWGMLATRELGAPGEMDENNRIRRVSVTPSPYSDPHPPVFVASNASLETVEFCGPRGFIPSYFSKIDTAAKFGQAYVDAAARAGLDFKLGQNQALCRWLQLAETEAEARENVVKYDLDIYKDLYVGTTPMKMAEDPVDSVLNSGMWIGGSIEQVRDQFVEQWKRLPAEYVVMPSHFAQQPAEDVIRQLELFMTHVKPALDEMTQY